MRLEEGPHRTGCGECGGPTVPLGEGTERLGEALDSRYPDQNVTRIDSDTTRLKGSMDDARPTEADMDLIQRILPHRYPFLLVDRVVEITPTSGVGLKNVTFNGLKHPGSFCAFKA